MFNILIHKGNEGFISPSLEWLSSRIQTTTNAGKAEKREPLYNGGGNVN
jgi:hypothetical protein